VAALLDQHPGVTVARPKEPDYFTRNFRRGLEWYRTVFPASTLRILVDASTSYAMAPAAEAPERWRSPDNPLAGVPGRIHAVRPDARIIYLLRDPVARTYSSYWHRVRVGEETEDFRAALGREDRFYLRVSDYHAQVRAYLEFFPLRSFLFLLFEDLVRDPAGTSRRCLEFLGADTREFRPDVQSPKKNASFVFRGPAGAVTRLFPHAGSLKLAVRAVKGLVPERLHPLIARAVTRGVPPMREEDREFLVAYFRERNQALQALTGLRLDRWQR
jgi:hypothetical protein